METSQAIDPTDLFSAKGLIIVLTGGGTGIGLAFATALARSGASKIYILGRRLPPLRAAAESISTTTVIPLQCDITDPASISSSVKHIEQDCGYVDVVINNAGVTGPHHDTVYGAQSIEELQRILLGEWEAWDTTWRTNTAAVVAVSAAFLHLLDEGNKRRGWVTGKRSETRKVDGGGPPEFAQDRRMSQIITVSSIAAFNKHITAGLAYTASKAGSVAVAKSLANLLAPWGIRSNVILPGRFPSEMTACGATIFPVDQVPSGTVGEYEDLASTILYLVGKAGAYSNGNVMTVDGGRLQVMPAMG